MKKKTVFLTGSSGNMGFQGFKELYARKHMYNIVLLNLDDERARKKFQPYENDPSVRLVWGNLMNYEDVLSCVTGADYVLHVGGMVSPAADYFPKKTFQVNVGAMKNIVRAVKAQPNADEIKVVYIGTVAEYGDRNPPTHWGRAGDPIQISVYDHYAISKAMAEQLLAESGLRYWVSLRQTGILYPSIINNLDPIMFHVPINGVLEWATVEDSGRLIAKVCNADVPDSFWRNFYNISSGKEYRLTNYEFESYLLEAIGLGKKDVVKRIFDANWFILQNFHGVWYTDSDKLEQILHFRANIPVKDYFKALSKLTPPYFKLSALAPKGLVKSLGMKKMANTRKFGTQTWITNDMKDRITAYYGSIEKYRSIGSWKEFEVITPGKETKDYKYLDHGYDESKDVSLLTLKDLQKAAQFRGGECLAESYSFEDFYKPIKWRCGLGHEFEMSPNLVLKGGHWCPDCLPMPWNYDEIARHDPFFAQVWYSHHGIDEHNVYGTDIYYGYDGFGELYDKKPAEKVRNK